MGFAVRLSPGTPTQRFTLDIPAVAALILNPTVNTVLVRVGGMDAPVSVDNASFFVPPGAALTYPVEGRTFCFTLGEPISLTANPGYPTSALVEMISIGDAMPQFASMTLNAAFSAIVLGVQADRPAGTYSDVYPLPKGVRSVTVRRFGGSVSDLYIRGVQTNRYLLNVPGVQGYNTIPGSNISSEFTVLVDSELDDEIEITTVSPIGANNGYTLIGYQERLPHSVFRSDARQMVDVLPPGLTGLPIRLDTALGKLPVDDSPGAPTYRTAGRVIAPAINAIIGTLAIPVAGRYRVEVAAFTDDSAAVGKWVSVSWENAAASAANRHRFAPAPGSFGEVWGCVETALTTDVIRVRVGLAGAAGSSYAWSIAVYALP